jgi:chromosome condensin MukBEF MukE localization factor
MTKAGRYCVFISYAWGKDGSRKEWVNTLATRLMTENGIEVIVDLFDLKIGSDKDYFMEQILSDEVDNVLIICDKEYLHKANNRSGGVGIETQIITPEVYKKVDQTKFVPIVVEVGEEFDSYIPTYLKTRIGIDMSSIEAYEQGYEKLLRHISNQPEYVKPKLSGSIPNFNEKSHALLTTSAVRALKTAVVEDKYLSLDYNLDKFKNGFVAELEKYRLRVEDFNEPYDEIIYNHINDMLKLRNEYISFIKSICINKDVTKKNIGLIKNLLEKILDFNNLRIDESGYRIQCDHYRLFTYEIFLYTIAILLRNEAYSEVRYLLGTIYFYTYRGDNREGEVSVFCENEIESIDESRNTRLGLNKICLSASLIIGRSKFANDDFKNDLITADLLTYYVQAFKDKWWFPRTYVYYSSGYIPRIFSGLKSKREFNRLKDLYGVNDINEMKDWLSKVASKEPYGYSRAWRRAPSVLNFIKFEDICKYE